MLLLLLADYNFYLCVDTEVISYNRLLLNTEIRIGYTLEWYTRVYITRDYGITYLFHDHRARANMGLGTAR